MKESEIARPIRDHGGSLGVSSRRVRVRHAVRWRRVAQFGIASFEAIAAIAIVIWPRDSVANTLARVQHGLGDAKTMEIDSYIRVPGRWYNDSRTYYSDGMWREDFAVGTYRERTTIDLNGLEFDSHKVFDFAVVSTEPTMHHQVHPGQTALDFLKKQLTAPLDGDGSKKSVRIQPHDPFNGAPTYLIVIDQFESPFHLHNEILVDKSNERPILWETRRYDPSMRTLEYKSDIKINQPLNPELFSFKREHKPIVRIPEDTTKLLAKFGPVPAKLGAIEVCNVTVTKTGTVWIFSTVRNDSDMPGMLEKIEDNLGSRYIRMDNKAFQSEDTANFRLPFKGVQILAFVPMKETHIRPKYISLVFSNTGITPSRIVKSIAVRPTFEDAEIPSYFRYLRSTYHYLNVSHLEDSCRAKELESEGDLLGALHEYEKFADPSFGWMTLTEYSAVSQEARLCRKLGEIKKADELTRSMER